MLSLHLKKYGIPIDVDVDVIDAERSPCPTIMAGGIGSVGLTQYWIEGSCSPMQDNTEGRPPYSIPSMADIRRMQWNGMRVASTFSGAGGSCTGYRMAGFKVVWANEFVPIAQESYKANADQDSILDPRDIRLIQSEEILSATGLRAGDLDIFDGSPPCQAFSTAGKRHKGWGKAKEYEHGAKQCNETLFTEYIRLLRGLQPKVFVAENVSGLLKGTAKGFFLEILRELKASGYRVQCQLLDAQWLGVPQQRQRAIFIGVRNDLARDPAFPKPLTYRYSVRDAMPWLQKVVHDTSGLFSQGDVTDRPSPASHHYKVIHGNGGLSKTECTDTPSPTITATQCGMIVEPETDISKYAIASEYDKLNPGEQSGKYFSLVKTDENKPSPTIQASHGPAHIAQPLHPTERRKFTIDEVKRLCSFPDDFVLCGSYSQQWERLGNSVPPLMMRAIAEVIRDEILK